MKGMPKILDNCKTLVVEFLPHHIQNVADISVEKFLSVIPKHMTNITIPSKNETHPMDIGTTLLKKMFLENKGDDGIIFTSNK